MKKSIKKVAMKVTAAASDHIICSRGNAGNHVYGSRQRKRT